MGLGGLRTECMAFAPMIFGRSPKMPIGEFVKRRVDIIHKYCAALGDPNRVGERFLELSKNGAAASGACLGGKLVQKSSQHPRIVSIDTIEVVATADMEFVGVGVEQ